MKVKSMIVALLLMVTDLQTSSAQGFRVYKSDGTVVPFSSHRTDSITFNDGMGIDMDFNPYMVANQYIVGTWYERKEEAVTFYEDGSTNYLEGATYEFMPYQGIIIIYNTSGAPISILRVYKITTDLMIVGKAGSENYNVWSSTPPVIYVTGITLSDTSLILQPNEMRILSATVFPEDADNKELTWESSDDDVAEVNKNGRVIANANGTCTITCSAKDGSGVKAECMIKVDNTRGVTDGHEWVDLGLPSGTKWATCNIGASSPEAYGNYYAWGETSTKSDYMWNTYRYCNGSAQTLTKYCTSSTYGIVDNKTELNPEDDAATANWGSNWQIPSLNQCQELYNSNYTTTIWTTQNGVNGRKITSKNNGNSIFLPAGGYREEKMSFDVGSYGHYWSRSLSTDKSIFGCCLYFSLSFIYTSDIRARFLGASVRPVRVLE